MPAQGPPQAYKTFGFAAPLRTHWRKATCDEVACPDHLNGWRTIVSADSPQASYIRSDRSRQHVETRQEGGLAEFTFEAGQTCFKAASHRIRSDRDPRYYTRLGDWRRLSRPQEVPAYQWQEQFAQHQDNIAKKRG
jgi:hypothetical protein